MTSLHDLRFSPPPNSKSRLCLCIKPCAICIPDTGRCILVLLAHLHERLLTTLQSRGGVEDTKLKAKDTKKVRDQGQGQPLRGLTLSRPRTQAQVQKKKVFTKFFQALHKILTIQKIVLSSSRGQASFRGLETSRPRPMS